MRLPWRRKPKLQVPPLRFDPVDDEARQAIERAMTDPIRGDFDSPEQMLAISEAWKTGQAVVVNYDDQGRLRVRHHDVDQHPDRCEECGMEFVDGHRPDCSTRPAGL